MILVKDSFFHHWVDNTFEKQICTSYQYVLIPKKDFLNWILDNKILIKIIIRDALYHRILMKKELSSETYFIHLLYHTLDFEFQSEQDLSFLKLSWG